MILTKIVRQKKRKNFHSLYIDGAYSFGISDDIFYKYNLKEGQEINQDVFDSIFSEQQKKSAMDYALRLLSIRSRSKKELEERFRQKGFTKQTVDYTTGRLTELGYINDTQFAKDWANFLRSKAKGIELIKIELKRKDIDPEIINEVLKDSAESRELEREQLKKLAAQKLGRMRNLPPHTASRRLVSFLARRGFSIETIEEVLKEIKEELK